MKAPRVLFISKEGMATFWFLLGAAAIVWSAIYVLRQSITAGLRPQFIIMTANDVRAMVPEMDPAKERERDLEQTRLAMDSIFNKSPSGLDTQDRCKDLLSNEAWDWVRTQLVEQQAKRFRDLHIHQKVEIDKIDLRKVPAMDNTTIASVQAQLICTGVVGNRLFNEVWDVRAEMVWVRNPSLRTSGRIPTICDRFQARQVPIQSTQRYSAPGDGQSASPESTEPESKATTAAADSSSH
jgi:hypothetical protein